LRLVKPAGSPSARRRVLMLLRISLALAAGSLVTAVTDLPTELRDALLIGALTVALGALVVAARARR
jgi:hypothetical protein